MRRNSIPPKGTWTFMGKALSIAQPWASAIAYASKDIENRSWRTHYRGPLAIHASNTLYENDVTRLVRVLHAGQKRPLGEWITRRQSELGLEPKIIHGHIIAIAMLVDCVDRSKSVWFRGEWGWVLEGLVPIVPVRWTGGRGLLDCKFRFRPIIAP